MPRDTPDHEKNDFQNAVKRNLHTWAEWRTMINQRLVEAVISGQNIPEDVESFDRYMTRSVRQPDHPTTNPKTLLTYSASPTTATSLRRGCFYKYGIPRVKLDPQRGRGESVDGRFGSTSSMSSSESNTHSSQSSLSDEDLALDYFYYERPAAMKREERTTQRRLGTTSESSSHTITMDSSRGDGYRGEGTERTFSNFKPARGARSSSCSRERSADQQLRAYSVKQTKSGLMRFQMDDL